MGTIHIIMFSVDNSCKFYILLWNIHWNFDLLINLFLLLDMCHVYKVWVCWCKAFDYLKLWRLDIYKILIFDSIDDVETKRLGSQSLRIDDTILILKHTLAFGVDITFQYDSLTFINGVLSISDAAHPRSSLNCHIIKRDWSIIIEVLSLHGVRISIELRRYIYDHLSWHVTTSRNWVLSRTLFELLWYLGSSPHLI